MDTYTSQEADRAILNERGHIDGPMFNGPRAVQCIRYDEHRWDFRRVRVAGGRVIWHCATCHEMDYKHERSCPVAA